MYQVGSRLKEKYQITALLGHGAMGIVYAAEHLLLKRRVALKCLHPSLLNDEKIALRFHREALSAAAIEHPNVLQVLDLEATSDGAPILVTELLEGKDLDKCLRQGESFSPERIVNLLSQTLSALGAAHQQGIIHRDIKPHNLFLSTQQGAEHLTIIDFGIAKILEPTPEATALTTRGITIGTPAYMSPEQINAEPLDPRADLWSVGVILYQLLYGRRPFDAPSSMGIALNVLKKAPDFSEINDRPGFYQELGELCRRALSKEREGRPASAAAFREEVLDILARSQRPTPRGIEGARPAARHARLLWAGLGAGALGALLLLALPLRSIPLTTATSLGVTLSAPPVTSSAPASQPQAPLSQPVALLAPEPTTTKNPNKNKPPKGKSPTTEAPTLPAGQNKFSYAKGLVLSRKYQEAVPLLEEVVKEQPQNDSAHRWLGDAYLGLKKKSQARQQWQEFLDLNPTHPDARKVKADIEALQ